MLTRIAIAAAIAVTLLAVQSAGAQAVKYPDKPIRIVVAYTPAGATDILARTIGQKMKIGRAHV